MVNTGSMTDLILELKIKMSKTLDLIYIIMVWFYSYNKVRYWEI